MKQNDTQQMMIRIYAVAGILFLFALGVFYRLGTVQFVERDELEQSALNQNRKMETLEAKRGNIYSVDGALLATSVPSYHIYFDPTVVKEESFNAELRSLADSLAELTTKPSSYWVNYLKKARSSGDRYVRIARDLDYRQYVRLNEFPIFEKGRGRGGLIVDMNIARKKPLSPLADRLIGYYKETGADEIRVGIEGAFNDQVLEGKPGMQEVQRIQKGLWKPVSLDNRIEPEDGKDVVTTLNSNIQDIAHQALNSVLTRYKAEKGTVIVMDVKSGAIRAMSNLTKSSNGVYTEQLNDAVGALYEPGSTFKLMSLVAALEDRKVDTSTVFHAPYGHYKVYDRIIRDSRHGGYGAISLATAFTVSSNTAFAEMIHEGYKENPEAYVNRLYSMKLHQPLDIPIAGEASPKIRYPGEKGWSGVSLAFMSHGYEVSMTPLQVLSYYNAIANDGVYLKPQFIEQIRRGNQIEKQFKPEVVHPSIASKATLRKVQRLLRDVVEKPFGTAHKLYDPYFSMAGKTGTSQVGYQKGKDEVDYVSSFAGYFPADNPQYSCIVVVHRPDKNDKIYGADVAGPVFKSIAQKIYATSPHKEVIQLDKQFALLNVLSPSVTSAESKQHRNRR